MIYFISHLLNSILFYYTITDDAVSVCVLKPIKISDNNCLLGSDFDTKLMIIY